MSIGETGYFEALAWLYLVFTKEEMSALIESYVLRPNNILKKSILWWSPCYIQDESFLFSKKYNTYKNNSKIIIEKGYALPEGSASVL